MRPLDCARCSLSTSFRGVWRFGRLMVARSGASSVCEIAANNISVNITADNAVPLLADCLPHIRGALHAGIDYADDLQPDPGSRDPWFWSHSARYRAKTALERTAPADGGWALVADVPNSGIHVRVEQMHIVRVLRSAGGTTPAPGQNLQRRRAWSQQLSFPFASAEGELPPLNLILDWSTDVDGSLVMHAGMPVGVWPYGKDPMLAWRVPLPADDDIGGLAFVGSDEPIGPVPLRVHDSEQEAQ